MKKGHILSIFFAVSVSAAAMFGAACSEDAAVITEFDVPSFIEVNVNSENVLPTVTAVSDDGKKYPAAVEITDEAGNAFELNGNVFTVSGNVGDIYDAVFYVELGGKRTEKTCEVRVVDHIAPTLIVPAEEVRVVPGKYIEIEDYYSVKDNTSVQETNYTLAHDGETVSEEEGFFAESGVYEYRISAEDGYGNVSEKTISFHVDDVVIEFGDAASVSVAAGHAYGALVSDYWYWKSNEVFQYRSAKDMGAAGESLRDGATGALYYDFSYSNIWTTEFMDVCGVLIPETLLPDFAETFEITVYLAAEGENAPETARWGIYPDDTSLVTYSVPTNEWVTIEIPASKIYETKVDFYGDKISYYSIGSAWKSDGITAFYVDRFRIKNYSLDESAVKIKDNAVFPDGEIDLTGFASLSGADFSYRVSYNGEELTLNGNRFFPVGSGEYNVVATVVSGEYIGRNYAAVLRVQGGYRVEVDTDKEEYEIGEPVVIDTALFFEEQETEGDVEMEIFVGGDSFFANSVFTPTFAGKYRIKASYTAGEREYYAFREITVNKPTGLLKSFNDASELDDTYAYLWTVSWIGWLGDPWEWKEQNGEKYYVYRDKSELPEEVAAGLRADSSGAAVGTPEYFSGWSQESGGEKFLGGLMLDFSGVQDYDYIVVRAYLVPQAGMQPQWALWYTDSAGTEHTDVLEGIEGNCWIDIKMSREQVELLHFSGNWYGVGTPRNCSAVYIDTIRYYKTLESDEDAIYTIAIDISVNWGETLDLTNYFYLENCTVRYEVTLNENAVPMDGNAFQVNKSGTYRIRILSEEDCYYSFAFEREIRIRAT